MRAGLMAVGAVVVRGRHLANAACPDGVRVGQAVDASLASRMGNQTSRACGTTRRRTSRRSSFPKELAGRTTFTPEELQARAETHAKNRIDAGDSTGPDDVGFYALYWFDWYWRKPLAGDWPALVVEPQAGGCRR